MNGDRALPRGWAIATLSDLVGAAGIISDGDWVESKDQDPQGDVRLIQLADIGDGEFLDRSKRFLTSDRANLLGCTYLEKGDVLIARMPGPIGRSCIFPGDHKRSVTVVDVFIFRSGRDDVDHRWAMYAINASATRITIEGRAAGTTRKRIAGSVLKSLELPIPPSNEQRRIADYVESLTARTVAIQRLIETGAESLITYEALLMKAAFSGELTRSWRMKHPHSGTHDGLIESVATRSPGRKVDSDTSPAVDVPDWARDAMTPSSWRWARLDAIASIQSGIQKGKRRKAGTAVVPVPYLRVANVQRGHLDLSEVKTIDATKEEVTLLSLQRGDVLLNEGGDRDKLGRGWVWNDELPICIHQNHVYRARIRDDGFIPALLSHYCNSVASAYFYQHATQSVNLASINRSALGALPVPLIPVTEQRELVLIIDRELSIIRRLGSQLSQASERLGQVRQQILDAAICGLLVRQEVEDEPAQQLLQRIRLDRAARETPSLKRKSMRRAKSLADDPQLILDLLRKSPAGETPERLFHTAGYVEETVDDFFAALKKLVYDATIVERDGVIFLSKR